jgi:glucose/arabinose dehydrogenase
MSIRNRYLASASFLLAAAPAALLPPARAAAATLPAGFSETTLATGLVNPTAMAFAPDGRLFVCQQGGQLRVIRDGTLLSQPFLTVSVNSAGERGLLGVAFDPDFANNRFVYVYYTTASSPIHNRLSRFTASAANPDVAAAGSEVQLLNLPNLSTATNHNGGAIHFGADGRLYIAVGENANSANAPSLNTTLGKILRINSDGTIPSDNPFFTQTTGINQAIWARGLRNPFTFAFQPGTGRLHINDVGQDSWEEVNLGIAGANYGWPSTEGPNPPGVAGVTYPIHFYQNAGSNCAIVGAAFYNPPVAQFPAEFVGRYFFGDFCGGFIRTLSPPGYTQSSGFATGIDSLVDLAVGPDGALYYLARGDGSVVRVQFTGNAAPQITQHPQDRTVAVGQPASFTVAASGVQPLAYQWRRDGVDVPGATSPTFTLAAAAAADDGATFSAVVTNDFGSAESNPATLTVIANAPPVGTITTPVAGTLYRGGESFSFSGAATDPEDGTLPAAAFTWRVDFHHDDHTHPFVPPTTGVTSGSFTIPTRGETSANVFFRIVLTVRDSAGLTHTTTRDLTPRTSVLTLATQPPGLQVTLDGQPVTTPASVVGVEGVIRALGAVSPQTSGGTTYTFVSWSDGGASTHEISTPIADTTFTATYQAATVTTVFSDQFATNLGWVTNPNGTDTATTGAWQRGDPQPTSSGGIVMQVGTGAAGTTNCLATGLASGASVGANDVDGGVTSIQSPPIALPATGTLTLSFAFYFAHLNNSSSADFFRVSIVGPGGTTTVFQELGAAVNDAGAWTTQSVNLSAFAGQTIRIRFEAADNAPGSLVEAGVDSVFVRRQ